MKNKKSNIKNTNPRSKTKATSLKVEKDAISTSKSVRKSTKTVLEATIPVKEEKSRTRVSAEVKGLDGKKIGTITLPSEIFGAKVNPTLMAQAVRVYLANQRAGSASTKTRGEVRGSTRKIYRQKGTGRARHGGIRAPIFVGGGIAFGPKPRDFSQKLPKKMKRAALFSALTAQFQDNKIIIADNLNGIDGKTKKMNSAFAALHVTNKAGKGDNVLFVIPGKMEQVERATRNIAGITLENVRNLNTYTVLNSKFIVFIKEAIGELEKTFLKN